MSKNIRWLKTIETSCYPENQIDDCLFPSISIVTPSYNQGQYIEETIYSVLNQGYSNLQYIIVDDCSTDNSQEIISKYKSRLTYIQNEKNGGQAEALNKGFLHSSGDILGTINCDDVYLPYTLNLVGRIFKQFPEVDWITGHSSFLVDNEVISPRRNHLDAYNSQLMKLGFYTPWLMGVPQHISTFFRKNLYEKAGGYIDIKLRDSLDIDLWIRMANYSAPVFLPATLALMRLHSKQKSAQKLHSKLAFNEIEKREYGFLSFQLRKIMLWSMRHYGFRGLFRRILFEGKAQRFNWNINTNSWEICDCYVF